MFSFGPAGTPHASSGGTLDGIAWSASHGLRAYEIEFVHGVNMGAETAKGISAKVEETKEVVSAHAPYYLNLLSEKELTRKNSRRMILESCAALDACGGKRVVIHTGFYMGMEKGKAFETAKTEFEGLIAEIEKNDFSVVLAPEITGKHSAFGDVPELFRLAKELGLAKLNPCVDFAHLHARSNGKLLEKKDFDAILNEIKNISGVQALQSMHIHFSGIAFTEKGEKNHLPIDSGSPPFLELAKALKSNGCAGSMVCESPELERDALKMQAIFEKA